MKIENINLDISKPDKIILTVKTDEEEVHIPVELFYKIFKFAESSLVEDGKVDIKNIIQKIKGNNLDLSEHVKSIVKEYGSIRKTAKALGISDSYIKNMVKGTRTNPSRGILLGLGLRKVITEHYERICFK